MTVLSRSRENLGTLCFLFYACFVKTGVKQKHWIGRCISMVIFCQCSLKILNRFSVFKEYVAAISLNSGVYVKK